MGDCDAAVIFGYYLSEVQVASMKKVVAVTMCLELLLLLLLLRWSMKIFLASPFLRLLVGMTIDAIDAITDIMADDTGTGDIVVAPVQDIIAHDAGDTVVAPVQDMPADDADAGDIVAPVQDIMAHDAGDTVVAPVQDMPADDADAGDIVAPVQDIMADDVGDNIFVYTGEQEVPADVTHVIIDRSIKIIPERAFLDRRKLVSVETHDGIEIVEELAFCGCWSLRGIKLPGVKKVGDMAFSICTALTDVEFGDKLETIGSHAFCSCYSLQKIYMPSVRTIEDRAFGYCKKLTDVEFGDKLERMVDAFRGCINLERIAIPLKLNMFPLDVIQHRYTQFDECENLARVDLVGGIHKTISSLLLESWRNEMNQEIDRINRALPNAPANEKISTILHWIRQVLGKIELYKAEHCALLKEATTLLELALWKAKLDENEDNPLEGGAKIDTVGARNERRITSRASIVIKNALPFLQLE
jgi:hypothetical protein